MKRHEILVTESRRHLSPRGDEFEIVGRAGPVRVERTPYIPAEAREELLVLKDDDLFLCSRPDGDIHPARTTGEGLYARDTRFLSELRLELGGTAPVALSWASDHGRRAEIDATNATLRVDDEVTVPQQSLNLKRSLTVAAGRFYHLARVTNFVSHSLTTTLTISLAGDFADVFEVRGGLRREARGHALAPRHLDRGVALAYVGADEVFREALVEFEPMPDAVVFDEGRATARWELTLHRHRTASILVVVEPSIDGRRRRRRRLDTATAQLREDGHKWVDAGTAIESDNALFDGCVATSIADLRSLLMDAPGGQLPAAGIPWYVAPFGRDSLLASHEALLFNSSLARGTLQVLAGMQATADDPWRDAEPGKILHELRSGELANAGLIPHTPYFGTVDATPLFLMLAAAYHRWTADLEAMQQLRPAMDSALEWIDRHGDADGDGFIEYQRRSPAGLQNHGWKDSADAVVHADGTLAEGPIALVEAQGYVYMAKVRIADVYEALGSRDVAERLRQEAQTLRAAFNEAFWDPAEGTFVLALDGRKRQVRSVTSNPLHCLYCGIVDPDKAAAVAERTMAPDMFCGWGVRTLSSDSPAYNPMSYHNGSIWPHDNALAAAGLKRYRFDAAAERIAGALFDVAAQARDYRLPELYCGFDRGDARTPVAYPVACIPQAWAAAVPFMLIQTMLGISARAPEGTLKINRPTLPPWLERLELRNLHVGSSSVSLAFAREGNVTGVSLLEQRGAIKVNVALDPEPSQLTDPKRGSASASRRPQRR